MTTMKALYFEEFGGPDVLRYGDVPRPSAQAGEVLVRTEFIGVNFADIYRRRGAYHLEPHTPYINGYEAAGVVADGPAGMVGRRVLFVDVPLANAEYVVVPVDHVIWLPDGVDTRLAATVGLQGLTADFLAHDLGRNSPGDKVFVTSVAGGVGQILAQMLIADGVEVYGSASTEDKRQVALGFGVREVFPSRDADWVAANEGRFDTVYDGIGTTLPHSIALLKRRGAVVLFGMAGGAPPMIDPRTLLSGSKRLLTGDLWDFLTSSGERQARADRLFAYLAGGAIGVSVPCVFQLADGPAAHRLLESGNSVGKVLMQPSGV